MRRRIMASVGKPLPYLRRVAYLYATSGQFIDTKEIPDLRRTKWEVDCQFDFSVDGHPLHGVSLNGRFAFGRGSIAWNDWYCGFGTINYRTGIVLDGTRHKFVLDPKNKLFEISNIGTFSFNFTEDNPDVSAFLFARNTSNGAEGFVRGNVWSAKMYDMDELIQDLNPVVISNPSMPNGEEGAMYDEVTGVIFRNQGTGEFTWGELET